MYKESKKTAAPAPALFVGHGSPMNAIEHNAFTESLGALGKKLGKPEAILMVSAHWQEPYYGVSMHETGELIYDFYGFPEALYNVRYDVPAIPDLAGPVGRQVKGTRIVNRPPDHGAWSVLRHLYPDADVPVMQFALNHTITPEAHLETARKLDALRDEGVMIIGSGNVTHNLRMLSRGAPVEWAVAFDGAVKAALERGDAEGLARLHREHPYGGTAHPSAEHYLPLICVAGVRRESEPLSYPCEGFELGSISMRAVLVS